ncbi:uncharacterized protein LOC124470905 isoform X2 [Hypomesus transpacificus]|uniref:uncharacterized protein LOC124470905 isoform X2 n=1 Tax=Hypomesus transpacificus TaxID=137520 RepID=UPI001F084372|nr:uncharacterized protein LOC124470905 isoform X2 [Hypomesus transpacificus]
MSFMSRLSVCVIELSLWLIAECQYTCPPCPPCPEGHFVISNCSKAESGECYGITYDVCRECRGVGQTTLVPCTAYSDAVCGCEVGYISNSTDICQKQLAVTVPPNLPGSTPYNWENGQEDNVPTEIIILLVILPVILLIMGGVLICLHRWISSQEFCKKVPRWGEQNV